jgi:ATP-dependent Clp protease ATP-binding subunit ClpX
MSRTRNAYCSFCRKSYRDVGPLVEGPGDVYICAECVSLCQSILDQEKRRRGLHGRPSAQLPTAAEIEERLGRYVGGQQAARKAFAGTVSAHYLRLHRGQEQGGALPGGADSILLVGPARSSRLFLARALAHVLGVPFAHGQATTTPRSGPGPGPGAGHPLWKLLDAAEFDLEAARHGIVYLDGVEQAGAETDILFLLDTEPVDFPRGLRVETAGILFLLGDEFRGIDEGMARRGRHPEQPISSDDLLALGLVPERLIRRVAAIVRLEPLDEDTLTRLAAAVNLAALAPAAAAGPGHQPET